MNKVKSFFIPTILCLAIVIFCSFSVNAQSIPNFTTELTMEKCSQQKTDQNLSPTILIYFAPDCEHCQVLIKGLLKKINAFKKSQIILVSFESLKQLSTLKKITD